ncbi:MAG: NAD(P)-dependent alcohol dehydrogenase [Niveispirillum sp.]|uniref:NAD(P)-dependent alcohol dehydrogenase n=1 Tax=Niveispirillum sp. TaxID=1917217 RepID=UPI00403626A3
MKITAAVTRQTGGPFTLEQLDIEDPLPGEVRVRILATGICHTDMVMRDRLLPVPQPVVLGHEGAGIVEAVGAGVRKVKAGDAVVISFNTCGTCPACAGATPSYCREFFPRNFFGSRLDGSSGLSQDGTPIHGNIFGQSSFATHALAHERNVVKVQDDVPTALLGPLACGVMTGVGTVTNALKIRAGQSVVVLGAGTVGLSAIMAAKMVGAGRIIAIDPQPARRDMALSLGATDVIDPAGTDTVAAILALTQRVGVDYSIDTTARADVIRSGILMLAPMGECAVVGAIAHGQDIAVDGGHLLSGGRRLRGVVEGDADPETFIPWLVDLYRDGHLPFDRLVHFYSLAEINKAVEASERGQVIKPIILMPGTPMPTL